MLQPKRTKYRKAHKGRIHGTRQGRHDAQFRRLRPEGDRARPRDRAPDRGRAPRHHAPHEARRAASGSASSRTCRCRRKPAEVRMGTGKGTPEYWVVPREAGPDHVRDRRRADATGAEAFALAAAKLPIKTRFVARLGEEGLTMKAEDLRAQDAPTSCKTQLRRPAQGSVQPALPPRERPAREHGAGAPGAPRHRAHPDRARRRSARGRR